jgi:hypothetical protein
LVESNGSVKSPVLGCFKAQVSALLPFQIVFSSDGFSSTVLILTTLSLISDGLAGAALGSKNVFFRLLGKIPGYGFRPPVCLLQLENNAIACLGTTDRIRFALAILGRAIIYMDKYFSSVVSDKKPEPALPIKELNPSR